MASVAFVESVAGVEILALVSRAYGAHGAHGKLTDSFASSLASSSWLAFQRLQQWIHPRKKHEEPTFLQLPNVQTGCAHQMKGFQNWSPLWLVQIQMSPA